MFFFFKQKTAYEMRISDWSSDVCSSDLHPGEGLRALLPDDAASEGDGWRFTMPGGGIETLLSRLIDAGHGISGLSIERPSLHDAFVRIVGRDALADEIGRASWRERVWQYVEISVVAVSLKKKKTITNKRIK